MGEIETVNSKTQLELVKNPETLLQKQQDENLSSKVQRELNLLGDGISDGVVYRAKQMSENKALTALELGGAAAIGAAMMAMEKAGGKFQTVNRIAAAGLTLAFAGDVVRRAIPTGAALADNWNNPSNYEENKIAVAKYLGTAALDYPLMFASGIAGAGATRFALSRADANTAFPGTNYAFDRNQRPSVEEIISRSDLPSAKDFLARFGESTSGQKNLELFKTEMPIAKEFLKNYGPIREANPPNAFYIPSYVKDGVHHPGVMVHNFGGRSFETKIDTAAIAHMLSAIGKGRVVEKSLPITILPLPLAGFEERLKKPLKN